MLPEPRDAEASLASQKELIRSFMTATYSKGLHVEIHLLIIVLGQDSDNPKAIVPWKELQTRTSDYMLAKYLPPNVTLMDPSHLRADVVIRLMDHWYVRQGKQKAVIRFKQVLHQGHILGHSGQFQPSEKGQKRIVIADTPVDTEPDMSPTPRQHRSSQQDVFAGRPTVKKHVAGPGRSSQSWQGVDGVAPGNHLPVSQHVPALSLPTPPATRSNSTGRDGMNEPSVRLFYLVTFHLKPC